MKRTSRHSLQFPTNIRRNEYVRRERHIITHSREVVYNNGYSKNMYYLLGKSLQITKRQYGAARMLYFLTITDGPLVLRISSFVRRHM